MRLIKNKIQINNLKLKRENLKLKQTLVYELTRKIKDEDYDQWLSKTKKYIDGVNENIRISIAKEISNRKKLADEFNFLGKYENMQRV